MRAKWGPTVSASFSVRNGVKQGGILSPFLFNVYLDGLSVKLNETDVGCLIGGKKINHIMYADDIVLLAPSSKGLQTLLNICQMYSMSHFIKFNTVKSKILVIRSHSFLKFHFPKFHLNGSNLEEVTQYKYLGHIITSKLADDSDIVRAVKSVYASGMSIVRRFNMCPKGMKLKLFSSYCSQIYVSHLWNTYTWASGKKIEVAYNAIFRRLLGVPRFADGQHYSARALFATHHTQNVANVLRKSVYNFLVRINSSNNVLVSAVCINLNLSLLFRYWGDLLRPPERIMN